MSTKRIYLGCALTQAPEQFRTFAEDFRAQIKKLEDVEVLEFVGLEKGTAKDVVEHDLGCVRRCDGMIALVDYPSLGLGMELQVAIDLGKPVLCLHENNVRVTRMLHGYAEMDLIRLKPYPFLDWAVAYAKTFISRV